MFNDENPVAAMPDYRKPDAVCETCGAELFDDSNMSAREQQSASGKYCEECILKKCDNDLNRILFTNEQGISAAQIAAWINYQLFYGEIAEFDDLGDALHAFIKAEHDQEYFEWLMRSN